MEIVAIFTSDKWSNYVKHVQMDQDWGSEDSVFTSSSLTWHHVTVIRKVTEEYGFGIALLY